MPITLAKMAANTASITFNIGADTVTVVYYPGRVSDSAIAKMDASADEFNQTLASLIQSWDIYEDTDQTQLLPIDADHLSALGRSYRMQIARAIVRDIRPNAETAQTLN